MPARSAKGSDTVNPAAAGARLRAAPAQLTSFVGREREIDAIHGALATTRLLTLTGAGGSGKTRLALEVVSREVAASGIEGAWVELAPVRDAALLTEAVLAALGVREQGDGASADRLAHIIGDRAFLLVLDNCEHLVNACASLADALLRACPGLRLMATSREALGVTGETAWLVPQLSLPSASGGAAESSEAVQLFVQRARAVNTAFAITDDNRAAVVQICRRLDGLPLAIELAAARQRALTPQQVAARLDDRFRLLTTGNRAALPRHQTLRAAIDWSYALLDERERTLLARLGTFSGSFTLEGAETVCAAGDISSDAVLDLVSSLVDKSLVEMLEEAGVGCYRLLESVREYALERLDELSERADCEQRHAHYVSALSAEAEPHLRSAERPRWMRRLTIDLDNVRQALAWTRAHDAAGHLRLLAALHWFWFSSGRWPEAGQWLRGALSLDAARARTRERAALLFSSGAIAALQAQAEPARAQLGEAAAIATEVGDPLLVADAQNYLALALNQAGDPGAEALLLQTRTYLREANDLYGLRLNFLLQGVALALKGDVARAVEATEEGVRIARVFGLDRELAIALQQLATMAARAGDLRRASALVCEALDAISRDPQQLFLARALELMASCAAASGDAVSAARLYGAGQHIRDTIGAEMWSVDRAHHAPFVARARKALGEAGFAAAEAEGRGMGREPGVVLAGQIGAELGRDGAPEPSANTAEYAVPAPPQRVAPPAMSVRTFGGFEVLLGDEKDAARGWGFAKTRELFVLLLLHPEGKTREQVGLALWPDASAGQVRNNFHVAMHHLRRALGDAEWVRFEGDRYRLALAGTVTFDARDFDARVTELLRVARRDTVAADAWRDALALHRGAFLDGTAASDWHLEWRDRLSRLYGRGLEQCGASLLREGRLEEAEETFERLIREEPLDEAGYRGLVMVRAHAGDRAGAEREFRRYEDMLRAEGMGSPAVAMRALLASVRRGELP